MSTEDNSTEDNNVSTNGNNFRVKVKVQVGLLTGILFCFLFFAAIFVRGCCCTYVDNYEMGYKFNALTGQITHLSHQGYEFYPPFVTEVHTVDLRPTQVCINANSRVLNCKLVQFDPAGLDQFIAWHGRANYATTTSGESTTTFNSILMSYAYDGSGKTYPFLKVLRELKPEEKQ